MSDGYEVGEATCLRETEKALHVAIDGVGNKWIPKSQIHDNSEVFAVDHQGLLVVSQWFADKQGWL